MSNNHTLPVYKTGLDMSANIIGDKIGFENLELFSLQAIWTGADGTDGTCQVYLQASNNGVDWSNLNQDSLNIKITTANDNCIFDSSGPISVQWLRIIYESGDNTTGSIDLLFLGKSTK